VRVALGVSGETEEICHCVVVALDVLACQAVGATGDLSKSPPLHSD
jgi:hypothetical protein